MLMIGFMLMNWQIAKCTGSGVAMYVCVYIHTHSHVYFWNSCYIYETQKNL